MSDKVQKIREEIDKVKLIKQEIESYKESMKSLWPPSDFRRGQITAYNHILQFIDTLPEEHIKFPNERNIIDKVFGAGNLESWEYEEAKKLVLLTKEELLKDLEINKEPASEELESIVEQIVDPACIKAYGVTELANRIRKSVLQMNASKDLEEEINKYITGNPVFANEPIPRNLFNDCIIAAAHHFSEWQKQQMKETLQTEYEKGRFDMREEMMKALIGGEIVKDIHNQLSVKSEPLNNAFGDIKFGDKVKIIIVKEE